MNKAFEGDNIFAKTKEPLLYLLFLPFGRRGGSLRYAPRDPTELSYNIQKIIESE